MKAQFDKNNIFRRIQSLRSALIGGTFNALHEGHRNYIKLAFNFAEEVYILLSSDKYAKIYKSYQVDPYEIRKKRLENYIFEINGLKQHLIIELDSDYSLIHFCLYNDVTMAILTPEHYQLFERINRIREDEDKNPLLLLVTQRTSTREGFNISSTLISNLNYYKQISPTNYSRELAAYAESLKFSIIQPVNIPK